MNDEDGYNGYTNYETWLLCLNIDNDSLLYARLFDVVEQNTDHFKDYEIAEQIKQLLEDMFWNDECGVYKIVDVWTYRDWHEINWIEVVETRRDI